MGPWQNGGMGRIDVIQDRLFRIMPLPTPTGGPRVGRARIHAAAMAGSEYMAVREESYPGIEEQTKNAIQQMRLPATMGRQPVHLPDGTALPVTDWNPEHSAFWIFSPILTGEPGASKDMLDEWGRAVQVPRIPAELDDDDRYAMRMMAEMVGPSTTNIGLAQHLERVLDMAPVEVQDALDFIQVERINSGHRLNIPAKRLATAGPLNVSSLRCCFVVIVPRDITPQQRDDINRTVLRHKAAGFRKVATQAGSTLYVDQ